MLTPNLNLEGEAWLPFFTTIDSRSTEERVKEPRRKWEHNVKHAVRK